MTLFASALPQLPRHKLLAHRLRQQVRLQHALVEEEVVEGEAVEPVAKCEFGFGAQFEDAGVASRVG